MADLQQLLTLALASVLLVLVAQAGFRDNPSTRKWFIAMGSLSLFVVPELLAIAPYRWSLPLKPEMQPAVQILHQSLAAWVGWILPVVGGLLCAFRIFSYSLGRRELRSLAKIEHARVRELVNELQKNLGIDRSITICEGREACSSGGGAPILVLPANWSDWSYQTLRAVVTHELVHILRRDDLWLLMQRLIAAFFWWLPWMHLLPGLLEAAIEESCDDHAAAQCANSDAYLAGLVAAARSGCSSPRASFPAMTRTHLVTRVTRFLGNRHYELDSRSLYWAVLAIVAFMSLSWTVEFHALESQPRDVGRVVAIALPASPEHFELELTHEERAPPSPVRLRP